MRLIRSTQKFLDDLYVLSVVLSLVLLLVPPLRLFVCLRTDYSRLLLSSRASGPVLTPTCLCPSSYPSLLLVLLLRLSLFLRLSSTRSVGHLVRLPCCLCFLSRCLTRVSFRTVGSGHPNHPRLRTYPRRRLPGVVHVGTTEVRVVSEEPSAGIGPPRWDQVSPSAYRRDGAPPRPRRGGRRRSEAGGRGRRRVPEHLGSLRYSTV